MDNRYYIIKLIREYVENDKLENHSELLKLGYSQDYIDFLIKLYNERGLVLEDIDF